MRLGELDPVLPLTLDFGGFGERLSPPKRVPPTLIAFTFCFFGSFSRVSCACFAGFLDWKNLSSVYFCVFLLLAAMTSFGILRAYL